MARSFDVNSRISCPGGGVPTPQGAAWVEVGSQSAAAAAPPTKNAKITNARAITEPAPKLHLSIVDATLRDFLLSFYDKPCRRTFRPRRRSRWTSATSLSLSGPRQEHLSGYRAASDWALGEFDGSASADLAGLETTAAIREPLQKRMNDRDQFLCGLDVRVGARRLGIDDMLADVPFDDLGDQVHRAPAAGRRCWSRPRSPILAGALASTASS